MSLLPANDRLIDDLPDRVKLEINTLVKRLSDGNTPILIARHLCDLLPSQVRTRVLGDHAFVSQYGRMTRTIITVGKVFPLIN